MLLLSGVTSQLPELEKTLKTAVDKAQAWLTDAGVSTGKAKSAGDDASSSVTAVVKALLGGVGSSIAALASLAAFLSFTLLSLFFLLKDGPLIRGWVERHMGVPPDLGPHHHPAVAAVAAGLLRGRDRRGARSTPS